MLPAKWIHPSCRNALVKVWSQTTSVGTTPNDRASPYISWRSSWSSYRKTAEVRAMRATVTTGLVREGMTSLTGNIDAAV